MRGRAERLAVLLERHREVAVGFGVLRIEGEAPLDRLDPAWVLSATHQHHAEVVPHRGIGGVERHRALQQLLGPCERSEHCCLPRAITQLGGAKRLRGWSGRQRGNERGRRRRDGWRAHHDGKSRGTKYRDGAEGDDRPATTRPPLRMGAREVRPDEHVRSLLDSSERFVQAAHRDGLLEMLGATSPAATRESASVVRGPRMPSAGRPVDRWNARTASVSRVS